MTRHEGDIIFKTRRPADLQHCMAGAKGTLRLVGNPDPEGLVEVYYRPPQAYLEEGTLLVVLCRRLRGDLKHGGPRRAQRVKKKENVTTE